MQKLFTELCKQPERISHKGQEDEMERALTCKNGPKAWRCFVACDEMSRIFTEVDQEIDRDEQDASSEARVRGALC